jgi:DNA-binding response OmpR family regulator
MSGAESRRRVLVVESEPIVLDYIATVLTRAGYDVMPANDGKQASDLLHRHASDLALILVEILVPGLSAEFFASLPSLHPRIPVVLVTCLGTEEVKQQLGAPFPVLFKPFTPTDLTATIRDLALA